MTKHRSMLGSKRLSPPQLRARMRRLGISGRSVCLVNSLTSGKTRHQQASRQGSPQCDTPVKAPLLAKTLLPPSTMGKKNFYAVKCGNGGPAIFTSWPECEARVKGFQGAVFKGFVTRPEAQAFLDGSAGSAAAAVPAAKKAKGSDSGAAPSRPLAFLAPKGSAAASSSAKPNAFTALMSGKAAAASSGGGIKPGKLHLQP